MNRFFTEFDKFRREIEINNIFDSLLFENVVNELQSSIKNELNEWKSNLIRRLSDPLPVAYKHKKRPQHRIFPFKDTGELVSNIDLADKTIIVSKSEYKVHYKLIFDINFKSSHAFFTNFGIAGSNRSTGKWVGWAERVLNGKGNGDVNSVKNILDNVLKGGIFNTILQKAMNNA